jgi:hypothetical protein
MKIKMWRLLLHPLRRVFFFEFKGLLSPFYSSEITHLPHLEGEGAGVTEVPSIVRKNVVSAGRGDKEQNNSANEIGILIPQSSRTKSIGMNSIDDSGYYPQSSRTESISMNSIDDSGYYSDDIRPEAGTCISVIERIKMIESRSPSKTEIIREEMVSKQLGSVNKIEKEEICDNKKEGKKEKINDEQEEIISDIFNCTVS